MKSPFEVMTPKGKMVVATEVHAAFQKDPKQSLPLEERTAACLAADPCPHRGLIQIRIEKKTGSCSCSDAPVFSCSAEQNPSGEASLWQFSRSQKLPCCRKCDWKPTST